MVVRVLVVGAELRHSVLTRVCDGGVYFPAGAGGERTKGEEPGCLESLKVRESGLSSEISYDEMRYSHRSLTIVVMSFTAYMMGPELPV